MKKSIGVAGIFGAVFIGAVLFAALNKDQIPGAVTNEEIFSEWGSDSDSWIVSVPDEGAWKLALVSNDGEETHQVETATNGDKYFTLHARRDAEKGIIKFGWYRTVYSAEDDPTHPLPLIDATWIHVDSGSLPDPFPKHGTVYHAVNGAVMDGGILMAFREHENENDPLAQESLNFQFRLVRE